MSCHLSVHHTNFSYLSVHKSTVLNSWWNVKQQNDIPLQDLAILTVQNNTRFMLFTMTSNTVLKEGMAGLPRSFKLCRTIRTHTHTYTHIWHHIHMAMTILHHTPPAVLLTDFTICAILQSASITCEDYSPARRDVYNV